MKFLVNIFNAQRGGKMQILMLGQTKQQMGNTAKAHALLSSYLTRKYDIRRKETERKRMKVELHLQP